jgi:hypothetical protein
VIDETAVTLNRLMGEQREPDYWERVCLVRALSEVFSGCYSLAMADARLALTAPIKEAHLQAYLPIRCSTDVTCSFCHGRCALLSWNPFGRSRTWGRLN